MGDAGIDILHGDDGNDKLRAIDGEGDVCSGGAGSDTAYLDQIDIPDYIYNDPQQLAQFKRVMALERILR
jgi:hypothetical protein